MIERKTKHPGQSRGNGVVLVLVDSRQSEFHLVHESVLSALGHFRMPYRVHDIGCEALSPTVLENAAAILIGQENFGLGVSSNETANLLAAVSRGTGLINLDPYLDRYDKALTDALGLVTGKSSGFETYGATSVRVDDVSHYITYTQKPGDIHGLRMPVPAVRPLRDAQGWRFLATANDGPAAIAGRVGSGRVVQWLVSPRLWTLQYFGHAHGLDDLFWKGIVWAARKPFAMLPMPPFVRFRFDDCNGLYRTAQDLAFLKVLNGFGHKPNMCVCMNALQDDGWAVLKELHDTGKVEVAPHTWMGGVGLFYGDQNGEYSEDKLRGLIAETKRMFETRGITPSKILSDHDHECSERVMPFLPQLGIEFKMNITVPGEVWTGQHLDWAPAPYGSMSYALDYIPGHHPLFVVFNHYPTFDFARVGIGARQFLLNRDGGFGAYKWDFLNGLTKRTLGKNDLESMANWIAADTRLGLNSLFFGGSISHSHFSSELTMGEWEWVLKRYEDLTARLPKLNVGYDDIAFYARSRHHTFIEQIDIDAAGSSRLLLSGEADTPLKLYVASEGGGQIDHRAVDIPAFSGKCEFRF